MRTFVCSDIHGRFDEWQKALKESGISLKKGDKLIILGDLIDRGNQSYECVTYALNLVENYPNQVVYLIGNHERLMLDFLNVKDPKSVEGYNDLYINGVTWLTNGGTQTVSSFLGSMSENFLEIYNLFHKKHAELLSKLNNLPYYHVDKENNIVYVHAGFQSNKPLNEQDKYEMIWIREEFHNNFTPVKGDVLENKLIIHGHTPVQYFDDYTGSGFYRGKHHLCVDGGSAMGEKVLVVNMDDMSYVEQKVQ